MGQLEAKSSHLPTTLKELPLSLVPRLWCLTDDVSPNTKQWPQGRVATHIRWRVPQRVTSCVPEQLTYTHRDNWHLHTSTDAIIAFFLTTFVFMVLLDRVLMWAFCAPIQYATKRLKALCIITFPVYIHTNADITVALLNTKTNHEGNVTTTAVWVQWCCCSRLTVTHTWVCVTIFGHPDIQINTHTMVTRYTECLGAFCYAQRHTYHIRKNKGRWALFN